MKNKTIAVGREHERNIEGHGVVEGLLHSVANAVVIVLSLDNGDWNIGLVIEDVIRALGLTTGNELSPDDDASLGESNLLADLHHPVPARAFYCGTDEHGTDIALAEVFLIHVGLLSELVTEFSSNRAVLHMYWRNPRDFLARQWDEDVGDKTEPQRVVCSHKMSLCFRC